MRTHRGRTDLEEKSSDDERKRGNGDRIKNEIKQRKP